MKIFIIIIIFAIILALVTLIKTEKYEVTYVTSRLDKEPYLVRDLSDKQEAADTLAQLKSNIFKFTNQIGEKKNTEYKDIKDNITQLQQRISNVVLNESAEDNDYTSYSVNKGEQIVFCLRSRYNKRIHDINLLMYVTLHELAHVASFSYGHTDEFKKVFAEFTKAAINMGLYKKIDFGRNHTEYCGITITDSII